MVFIFHILFFLFFVWGGWPSGITGNPFTWKILSSSPTDRLGQNGLSDPHYEAPDNLQIGHVECVSLTISYPLFFLCISKVSSMLHHDSVGWFHCKKCYTLNKVFKKRRSLRALNFAGMLGKSGLISLGGRRRGCNFHIKNKLKSEIINDKKKFIISRNIFLCHN